MAKIEIIPERHPGERFFYEWVIEDVDEHDDIINVDHADTYAQAQRSAALPLSDGIVRRDVGLVYNLVNEIEKTTLERAWAYIEDGKLPATFDNGRAVPKRFRKEVSPQEMAVTTTKHKRWTPLWTELMTISEAINTIDYDMELGTMLDEIAKAEEKAGTDNTERLSTSMLDIWWKLSAAARNAFQEAYEKEYKRAWGERAPWFRHLADGDIEMWPKKKNDKIIG